MIPVVAESPLVQPSLAHPPVCGGAFCGALLGTIWARSLIILIKVMEFPITAAVVRSHTSQEDHSRK